MNLYGNDMDEETSPLKGVLHKRSGMHFWPFKPRYAFPTDARPVGMAHGG